MYCGQTPVPSVKRKTSRLAIGVVHLKLNAWPLTARTDLSGNVTHRNAELVRSVTKYFSFSGVYLSRFYQLLLLTQGVMFLYYYYYFYLNSLLEKTTCFLQFRFEKYTK